MSTMNHPKIAPRVSFLALQHIRIRKSFFALLLLKKRLEFVALKSRSSVLGFGYPLYVFVTSPSLGTFSVPNAHELRSSKLFSFPVVEKLFRIFLSALALLGKTTTTLPRRFSGFLLLEKPFPFLLPEGLVRDGNFSALLSFMTS
jgi:hypothetical protein